MKAKEEVTRIRCSEVILDYGLYPREKFNSIVVSDYKKAMEAGAHFPPIVVDRLSKRLIDGWHRTKSFKSLYGETAEIDAILKDYKNEWEMKVDAARLNSTHGLRYSRYDMARLLCWALNEGNEEKVVEMSNALGLSHERVLQLISKKTATNEEGAHIEVKRGYEEYVGQTVTAEQEAVMKKSIGRRGYELADALLKLIKNESVDLDNPRTIEKFIELRNELINMRLEKIAMKNK